MCVTRYYKPVLRWSFGLVCVLWFVLLSLVYPVLYVYMNRRFRSLIPSYIRDSSVAVVVYDITSTFKREACAC